MEFLSTPSARRATRLVIDDVLIKINFYPRPPRGGRRPQAMVKRHKANFYPRPPRGGRRADGPSGLRAGIISIHALREEGDVPKYMRLEISKRFLSTPSARRATFLHSAGVKSFTFLSTPSARRATPEIEDELDAEIIFLSTPSARRATAKTETKSLFSYKLYNILHEFRRALIYNGSKNYPNHAK